MITDQNDTAIVAQDKYPKQRIYKLPLPLPFWTQYECRGEDLPVYASDRRGLFEYRFNNLGYRNDIDYNEEAANSAVYVGSSITSGIGIPWHQSFSWLSSQSLDVDCYHFSQGCMPVDNNEILRMITAIKQSALVPRYWCIQFIGLDRRYDRETGKMVLNANPDENAEQFLEIFDQVSQQLKGDTWCFFGCDESQTEVPETITKHARCVRWNMPFVDLAGVTNHPGTKWHTIMAAGVIKHLKNQQSA